MSVKYTSVLANLLDLYSFACPFSPDSFFGNMVFVSVSLFVRDAELLRWDQLASNFSQIKPAYIMGNTNRQLKCVKHNYVNDKSKDLARDIFNDFDLYMIEGSVWCCYMYPLFEI